MGLSNELAHSNISPTSLLYVRGIPVSQPTCTRKYNKGAALKTPVSGNESSQEITPFYWGGSSFNDDKGCCYIKVGSSVTYRNETQAQCDTDAKELGGAEHNWKKGEQCPSH